MFLLLTNFVRTCVSRDTYRKKDYNWRLRCKYDTCKYQRTSCNKFLRFWFIFPICNSNR